MALGVFLAGGIFAGPRNEGGGRTNITFMGWGGPSGQEIFKQVRLFQNFSFWNSNLRFIGKSGHLAAFSKSLFQNQPGFGTSSVINSFFA
jgi:hypothetical protein